MTWLQPGAAPSSRAVQWTSLHAHARAACLHPNALLDACLRFLQSYSPFGDRFPWASPHSNIYLVQVWVDVKFAGVVYNSEQFNTAGRSIGTGLLAVDVVGDHSLVATCDCVARPAHHMHAPHLRSFGILVSC